MVERQRFGAEKLSLFLDSESPLPSFQCPQLDWVAGSNCGNFEGIFSADFQPVPQNTVVCLR